MITTCNRCAGHVIEVRQQANEPEDSRYTSDNSQGGGAGQIPTTLVLKYRRLKSIFIPAKNEIKTGRLFSNIYALEISSLAIAGLFYTRHLVHCMHRYF
ncbi:TPA: hypothetical protein ACS78C_002940 [Providencia alcalifaciens]